MISLNELADIYALVANGMVFGVILSAFPFIIGYFVNYALSIIKSA